jgi:hypothetical protein
MHVQHLFRAAATSMSRSLRTPCGERRRTSAGVALPESKQRCDQESYAQVAGLVAPNPLGGLKPGGSTKDGQGGSTARHQDGRTALKRPPPLGVRFSQTEIEIVRGKAKTAGCSTNSYIRAAALGSSYRPPLDPGLKRALLLLTRELTAQGNNVNQIARHLNAGIIPSGQGAVLSALAASLEETLRRVREALGRGGPRVGP